MLVAAVVEIVEVVAAAVVVVVSKGNQSCTLKEIKLEFISMVS